MLWRVFVDPRGAVEQARTVAVLLTFLALVGIEVAAYQVWLSYPPFRNLNRDVSSESERSEPRRGRVPNAVEALTWDSRVARTWHLCETSIATTIGQCGFWFLVGSATMRRWVSVRQVAAAVVCAAAIMTAGRLAREGFIYAVGVDPGLFGFAAMTQGYDGWIGRLGRLTVFELWSAAVLAIGLSAAWHRPLQLVLPIVMGASLAWMLFPGLRDPQVWLTLLP